MHSFRIGKSIDLSHILRLLAPEVDIGNTLGELVLAFHYFRFNEIKQFGFGHYEIAPTDYSQLNYELFLDHSMNDDKILMRLPIKNQGIFAISLKLF